eukprot:CAMPEP_0173414770 /NCGR_PEP_ID=MMETSP1356-20130122/84503_1 /TAXON_ID=77927 ORGANISM="Hemiselmis virescens, Strain PCC157" /NCGR_SAMPLE_ID=MMETSP1356 /ASSEMBLY_ACC=CAM_ASM_000847 /LENGTH=362 /DNA_ID=CAMNT_0014376973 /DNA_START=32 /DNA_END=1120 /DNA_ORIENTATION=+
MEVLAEDVQQRMIDAMQTFSGRDEKLASLFADVCHPIDEDAWSTLPEEMHGCTFYYQALSRFFETDDTGSAMAGELLPLFTALWDTADVRNTFTLLMHRWIFVQEFDICKCINVITKSASSLFWDDLLTIQTRFQSLFIHLAEQITSPLETNLTIDGTIYLNLVRLTSRFVCYYDVPPEEKDLTRFVQNMERSAWWQRCVGPDEDISGAASIIAQEVSHQLEHIRSEEVLGECLLRMRSLAPLCPHDLDVHARIRLENILHSLGSPGGPLYPPRGIRMRARNLNDQLFPKGRYGRGIVHLSFRLLNPYMWPVSLAHFVGVQAPSLVWTWTVERVPLVATTVKRASGLVKHLRTGMMRLLGRG